MTDERNLRAAEYVLGHQDLAERDAVRLEIERDPAFAAAVARWEKLLSPMARGARDAIPPTDMLARIKAGLPLRAAASAEVIALRGSVRRWRNVAAFAGAIAASLVVFAGERVLRDQRTPSVYIAAVNRGGDAPALIVRVDMAANRVFVRPVGAETPSGKSLELWYIGDGVAPRSMGLVGAQSGRLPLPDGARLEKAKFAVTVEPVGGSPTGGPTGPIIYAGDLVKE